MIIRLRACPGDLCAVPARDEHSKLELSVSLWSSIRTG